MSVVVKRRSIIIENSSKLNFDSDNVIGFVFEYFSRNVADTRNKRVVFRTCRKSYEMGERKKVWYETRNIVDEAKTPTMCRFPDLDVMLPKFLAAVQLVHRHEFRFFRSLS